MQVNVVSAQAELFSGEADFVVASAEGGEIGIKPGHAPLIAALKPGDIRIQRQGCDEEVIYISGGFIEVQPGCVTVLSNSAERAADLDEAKAMKAQQLAEATLADKQSSMDYARARVELAQAMAQLSALRRIQGKLKK